MGEIFRIVWREFIYGGHLQSLGAASIIFVSAILLELPVTLDCLIISYLFFYPLYLYNRFKEIDIDFLTNPHRSKHLSTYLRYIPSILLLNLILVFIGLIYFSNSETLLFAFVLIALGLLYTTIFKGLTEKLFLFKNLYVALFFAALVFFFLIYYRYYLDNFLIAKAVILSVFVFFKALIMQIFFDLKDIESDRKKRLRTLPIIMGKKSTLKILKTSTLLVGILIPFLSSVYFNILPLFFLMLILTIPFNFYSFYLSKRNKYSGYIIGSGEFVLWSILILIGKFLI